jgi:hypothetical protein
MKDQDVFKIVANKDSVTFLKHGEFKWIEIASISSYIKISPWGSTRHEEKYLLINLVTGKSFSIEVTNCDYQLYEIVERLKMLGKNL